MKLKAILENLDELPDSIDPRDLFVEKDGKFELAIEGVKTQADVDRLTKALSKERLDHRGTKDKVKGYGDLTPESIQELQDELEELRASGEGKGKGGRPSDEQVQKLVQLALEKERRPLDKKIKDLETQVTTLTGENVVLVGEKKKRVLVDAIREVTAGDKGVPIRVEALGDVEMLAERVFTFDESDKPVTKEGVGFEPGLSPRELLVQIQVAGTKPHWFKDTEGAGATGGKGAGAGKYTGVNPFDKATFNLSAGSKMFKENPALAKRLVATAKDPSVARTTFAAYLTAAS